MSSGGASGTSGAISAAGSSASGGATGVGSITLSDLATGKNVTASTEQLGNEAAHGNDGNATTRWAASSDSLPQWWRVDLGMTRQLSELSVQFEHSDRSYNYVIETSQDDALYVPRETINAIGAVQTVDFRPRVSARYVRITVTKVGPVPNGLPWASFWEISVRGI